MKLIYSLLRILLSKSKIYKKRFYKKLDQKKAAGTLESLLNMQKNRAYRRVADKFLKA